MKIFQSIFNTTIKVVNNPSLASLRHLVLSHIKHQSKFQQFYGSMEVVRPNYNDKSIKVLVEFF